MRTITLISNKRGIGKTTAAVNLAHALAAKGRRVMLLDMDPGAALVKAIGLFRAPSNGVAQALLEGKSLDSVAVATRELLSVVPTGDGLEKVNELTGGMGEGLRLFESIQADPPDVDYLVIDGPSSAGLLFANAVLAADLLLVPVSANEMDGQATLGLFAILQRFDAMRGRPSTVRAFLNRTVGRGLAAKPVHDELKLSLGEQLLNVVVPDAEVVPQSAAMGRTLLEFRPQSGACRAFEVMAKEVAALMAEG